MQLCMNIGKNELTAVQEKESLKKIHELYLGWTLTFILYLSAIKT